MEINEIRPFFVRAMGVLTQLTRNPAADSRQFGVWFKRLIHVVLQVPDHLTRPLFSYSIWSRLSKWLGLLHVQWSAQSVQPCLQLVYLFHNNSFTRLKDNNYVRLGIWMQTFGLTWYVFGNTLTSSENGTVLMAIPFLASSPSTSGSRAAGLSSASNGVPSMKSSNQFFFHGVDS